MAANGEGTGSRILLLVEMFEQALAQRLWLEIRALFHDEALIESIAAGGSAYGPDATVAAMATAAAQGIYALSSWKPELLTPDAVLVFSRMRHQDLTAGSITDEGLYWLMTCRDDRFWRIRIFRQRAAAVRCLEENGVALGL